MMQKEVVQKENTGIDESSRLIERDSLPYPPPCQDTLNSFRAMQEPNYWGEKQSLSEQQHLEMFRKLGATIAKYQLPFGAINGVRRLPTFLNFIVDDSGSMNNKTDLLFEDASDYMQDKLSKKYRNNSKLTRWEEAEDRLHLMIDLMAYAPSKKITISFINRSQTIILEKEHLTIDEFIATAHEQIANAFKRLPMEDDLTPLHGVLTNTFAQKQGKKTAHYLLTDGEPSDHSSEEVQALILNKVNQDCVITIINCSDKKLDWVDEVDEKGGSFVSTIDDFATELTQVTKKQGARFTGELGLYPRAMWILANLVSGVWPALDKMDEPSPLSRAVLSTLSGIVISEDSYKNYYEEHPNYLEYQALYSQYNYMKGERTYPEPKLPSQEVKQTTGEPTAPQPSPQELIDLYYKLSVSKPLPLAKHANPAPQTVNVSSNSNTMFATKGKEPNAGADKPETKHSVCCPCM